MSRLAHLFYVVVFTASILAGCTSLLDKPEAPHVTVAGLKPLDIQLLEQRYQLTLRVQNPNRNELPIEGLSFSLEINGQGFAHGVSNESVTVPGFGEALLTVDIVSSLAGLIEQAQLLGDSQRETVLYRLKGKFSVSNQLFSLPFERSGELALRPQR